MAELRPYQQDLLEQAESALQPRDARVMLQLPTGGGKTHIAGALLRRWLHNGRKAVWLTHRTELAEQTRQMLEGNGVTAREELNWSGPAPYLFNGATILMAQTVGRRINKKHIWGSYNNNDLLVVDEAHHAAAAGYELSIEQWPGQVIGLTATPWRLSEKEGFNGLFKELICGPQIHELQAAKHLCQAPLLTPPPDDRIIPGNEMVSGEYTLSGIEEANSHEIMTVRAVDFWMRKAADRQTIVYAVSQDHARRLTEEFNRAGISADIMLSDTSDNDRCQAINGFVNGDIQVLVNMSIVTEGFDLPGDSCKCVVITRPTKSLALYLQMVGRGLRPKKDGGDCLIIDLAGNSEIHGRPEDNRQWSLLPRGNSASGETPVVRCEKCDGYSPAGSQTCAHCSEPFGKGCPRCGQWRAWQRWGYETHCGELHELVCDLCHYDAHTQAQLPVTDELRRLTEMDLDAALRNLLEEERQRASGADEERKSELRSLISNRASELDNNDLLDKAFKEHLSTLPPEEQPQLNWPQMVQLYNDWKYSRKQGLAGWKAELDKLESKVPNGRLIYNNARERLLQALEAQALQAGLLPQTAPRREVSAPKPIAETSSPTPGDINEWVTFAELGEWNAP